MLPPSKLKTIPEPIQAIFDELQAWIVKDISRRVSKAGNLTTGASQQITAYKLSGGFERDLQEKVKQTLLYSDKEIDKIFNQASGYAKIQSSGVLNPKDIDNLTKDIILTTKEELKNISRSMGFSVNVKGNTQFKPISEFYQSAIDNAVAKAATGAADVNTAVRQSILQMATSGLRFVDYSSGWINRVDVAVRRAVFGGLKYLSREQANRIAKELDTDVFEITYHPGHRPTHNWGGRRYSLSGSYGYPTPDELFAAGSPDDYGCLHDIFAVDPSSEPAYSNLELNRMEQAETEPRSYKGNKYTMYEGLQLQRKLEANMRRTRLKTIGFKEAGLNKDYKKTKALYYTQRREYETFCKQMKLPEEFERVYIDMLGRV